MNESVIGQTRRHFFRDCQFGLGAMALGTILAENGLIASEMNATDVNPLAAKPPHFAPRAKSVIFLFMAGGPSQLELFDFKPKLQKLDGQVIPPSFVENQRFAFIKKGINLKPIIVGGEQEKGQRAGTESLHNIAGMAKAFEISSLNLDAEQQFILSLKNDCITKLQASIPGVKVVGDNTFYNIINVVLPFDNDKANLILFNLDMKGIAVSRGSACQSGSSKTSHVLNEILSEEMLSKPNIRISFSHYNTSEDIDYLISVLKEI